eukprot:TRINITY_DN1702_c0_g1_i1.p1 TRINITY_DN1702_c0_g1~~TRINITY_DN1702_c0_g1_i1.p1  ORF type:complete len:130 (+),score=2.18 TRINITY_DN1702_c0_g1_i1:690-1079(+)
MYVPAGCLCLKPSRLGLCTGDQQHLHYDQQHCHYDHCCLTVCWACFVCHPASHLHRRTTPAGWMWLSSARDSDVSRLKICFTTSSCADVSRLKSADQGFLHLLKSCDLSFAEAACPSPSLELSEFEFVW